ncbi:MAG: acetyl-CoA C-acetyltransferase [Anaplasmataceae bacterium]|nr:acetyl-CoA C-acetyltransferase [Anaplasmataceae bacterium]
MKDVFIVEARRTAVGKFCGMYSMIPVHELGGKIIRSCYSSKIDATYVEAVIMGQVLTGLNGQNPARIAAKNAGLPNETIATTINQVCGSGLYSIMLADNLIRYDINNVIIAGGQENMTRAPIATNLRKQKYLMGDINFSDTMIVDGLTDAFTGQHMGYITESIAHKYEITREMQDEFAVNSQSKASAAQKANSFEEEIIAVEYKDIILEEDEFIRHDIELEKIAKLKSAFKPDGTITAGNSSGINDGAAATLLMNEDMMNKNDLKPLARIISHVAIGLDPAFMGLGPIKAINIAVEKANWSLNDVDAFEINEAFAAQSIAVINELQIDQTKVNMHGGAIALGHPIGASGARCLVTLIYIMKQRKLKKGVVSLCVGGGMGVAMCIEMDN